MSKQGGHESRPDPLNKLNSRNAIKSVHGSNGECFCKTIVGLRQKNLTGRCTKSGSGSQGVARRLEILLADRISRNRS